MSSFIQSLTCERCRKQQLQCQKPLDQKTRLPCQRCKDEGHVCEVKVSYRRPKRKKNVIHGSVAENQRAYDFLSKYNVKHTSVDARLGDNQRALFLGQHLVQLAANEMPFDFAGPLIATSGTYSLSWPDYWCLKSGNDIVDRRVDLWFHYALARSAILSPHSDILGGACIIDEIPYRRFNDTLLDLRSFGYQRHEARGVLTHKCLTLAVAPDSPLREKSEASIDICLAMLHTFNNPFLTGYFSRELIRIILKSIEHEYKSSPPDKKSRLLSRFELLLIADEKTCMDFGGAPIISDTTIRKYLKGPNYPTEYFVDPCQFGRTITNHGNLEKFSNTMWGHLIALSRHLNRARDKLTSINISQEEVEAKVVELSDHIFHYSKWRDENFKVITTPAHDSISASLLQGPFGPEPRWQSRTFLVEEAKLVFCLTNYLRDCRVRFPSNPKMIELEQKVNIHCDQMIFICFRWIHHSFKIHEHLNSPVMLGVLLPDLSAVRNFEYLPGGFRYIARWMVRNPQMASTDDIKKVFRVLNHNSWGAKIAAQRGDEFEEELRSLSGRQYELLPVRKASSARITDIVCLSNFTEDSLQEFSAMLRSVGVRDEGSLEREMSPSVDDFQDTLGQLLFNTSRDD